MDVHNGEGPSVININSYCVTLPEIRIQQPKPLPGSNTGSPESQRREGITYRTRTRMATLG